ncbi:uncharacterized protein PITG_10129 [Phytophthora infestans T30-4]|uniref:Tc1-like transposase DDE domain-containing protein n=1 Tax=Phytophthora infestans (strain T30-4) TaxID=403677 RepID=D0NED7_PHYIT|nr:uncharacterized protein PITG_10129 [Phytophthora infestans T30-4]EEY56582.1 conserved hypothetical protein [Phytophthora infestans T30-4]|eukprot:XP_002902656.1 conserved hypothetical protein [Phytophthora infestans T30-4]
MPKESKHGLAARSRVLKARREGRDWGIVAGCNDIPPSTACNIVARWTPDVKKRGGARAVCTECTPEMEDALVKYLEENCQYTLARMSDMIHFDFDFKLRTSLIISPEVSLVHFAIRRGSIRMEEIAAFMDAVYEAVKAHNAYQEHFQGNTIVIVWDNAPATARRRTSFKSEMT